MKSYRLIALTGTTGSGKSVVRGVFEENGYKVIDADILAREIMKNPIVLRVVQTFFGDDVVSDGRLDRRLLAQRAFADKDSTRLLGEITHPFITPLFLSEIERLTAEGADKIVFDAPQLFESGLNIICDSIVAVVADEKLRLNRIILRDNLTETEAKARINAQFSDEYFRQHCDYIIENNSTPEKLHSEALRVLEEIKR